MPATPARAASLAWTLPLRSGLKSALKAALEAALEAVTDADGADYLRIRRRSAHADDMRGNARIARAADMLIRRFGIHVSALGQCVIRLQRDLVVLRIDALQACIGVRVRTRQRPCRRERVTAVHFEVGEVRAVAVQREAARRARCRCADR